MRVLIFITNKPRDLANLARLAARLEARGHEARITLPWDTWTIARWKPHAIIVHTTEDAWLRRCIRAAKRRGARVIDLLAEGTISEYVAPSWAGADSGPKLDDVAICWGPGAKEFLVRYGRDPNKVVITGNPRFDVYAGALPTKEDVCARFGLDPDKPLVVYPTSLVPPVGIDKLDHQRLANFTDHAFPRRMALRGTTTEIFLDLAQAHPDIQFLVKPHPYDTPELFEAGIASRKLTNVTLVAKDAVPIEDVLNACDVMIHWNSTTSTEAWFLGKPTILMHFDPEIDYLLTQFKDGSDLVRTPEELDERLRHYLGGGEIADHLLGARREYIAHWFDRVDGRSMDRVLDVVEEQLAGAQEPHGAAAAEELWTHAQVWARKLLRRKPPQPLLPWKPHQPLYPTQEEIDAAMAKARSDVAAAQDDDA